MVNKPPTKHLHKQISQEILFLQKSQTDITQIHGRTQQFLIHMFFLISNGRSESHPPWPVCSLVYLSSPRKLEKEEWMASKTDAFHTVHNRG